MKTILCAGLTGGAFAADSKTKQVFTELGSSVAKEKISVQTAAGSPEAFIIHLDHYFPDERLIDRVNYMVSDPQVIELPELRVVADSAEQMFQLYNRLSEIRTEWGEWAWHGEFADASAIVLIDRKPNSALPSPGAAASIFQQRLRAIVDKSFGRDATAKPIAPPRINRVSKPSSDAVEIPLVVSAALQGLPPEDAELLNTVYVDGRAIAEVASEHGQSYKAMESRLTRLRRRVKEAMLKGIRDEERT